MKKSKIIAINLLIMALILFFIIQYANTKMKESNKSVIKAFEKMTISAEQIVTNYLFDEQHLCDIWANFINRSADAGTPMTAEEAISFIRKAKISPSIYGHLIFPEDPNKNGISTNSSLTDQDDYSVSYSKINLFGDLDNISKEDGVVNLTRAYTNPQNGVQSIAFMNYVKVLDETTGELKEAILMRVEAVSTLEDKLVFFNGEYDRVEISLINKDGDYLVHGKSMKNSNFFEYYKSYNRADSTGYNNMTKEITSELGTMKMLNSKGEECIISHIPLKSLNTWYLLAYIPARELSTNTVVDWLLLGMVTIGLLGLLVFNYIILMAYNRKLSEAAEAANQANEAKSHFLSTMSHDIRTPMNAILGLNEMVLRDSHEEEIVAYSESIRTAGKTLLGIINDILDFSKIEAGKMDIHNADYNFVLMLNDLVNMVQTRAEEKGLLLELDVDRDIPMVMYGDEIRIKQVITNILSNAVKYTKEGSITFKAGFKEEGPDSVRLLISVKDTGIGIKPEDMKRLFMAFERIEEGKNRNIEGTGLGMSIAQSFLNMMGSHIEVESEYGKGSSFSFELVQAVKDRTPIGDYVETFKNTVAKRKKYKESFTAPEARLLVVDDTEVNLSVIENLLKRTKVQIDTAISGDEGIVLYKQRKYDIIFLDHMMPDKDGVETLIEMREIPGAPNAHTPVICFTANALSGMRDIYISSGFDDYITKPVDPDRLEKLLLKYLPKEKIAPAADENDEKSQLIPEFIYDIEELVVASGLKFCGSDKIYINTVEKYIESAEKNREDIERYRAAGDLKNLTVKIHALKSSSRLIGASKLGDFAARLEKAGEEGDEDTLERDLGELLDRYGKLVRELEPLNFYKKASEAGSDTKDDRPVISPEDLKKAYSDIRESCKSFDFDKVSDIVESLENHRLPENENERFEALRKALDDFDYDKIPEILAGGEDS